MSEAPLHIAASGDLDALVWQIAALREQFLASSEVDLSPMRAVIRDSWQRCRMLAVNAEVQLARFATANDRQLAELRERCAALLRAASPVVARLRATLGDAGYVVALSDAEGTLLEVDGDPYCRRRLARKGLLPGSNWSEAVAGTNAIGVVLVTGRVVQLVGAEHYCSGWQDVTCTAAPIIHPDDGRLLGVLDITGDYRLARPFLTGVLAAAAAEVQRRYRLEWARQPARPRTFPGWTPPPASERLASPPHPQPDRFPRLAAAMRAISNSFDPQHTPAVITEHMGRLLNATGVALVEGGSIDRPLAYFWTAPGEAGERALAILQAAARDPVALAWRACAEPFIYMPHLLPNLAGFPLPDIGGVILVTRPAQSWPIADQQCGATLAAHGAAMLRYARLYTDLQAYAAQTEVINSLAFFLSTLLDPVRQLDAVVQRILALTRLDAGVIVLKEDQRLTVAGTPHINIDQAQVAALIETVFATGQPIWLCRQHAVALEPMPWFLTDFCDLVALPLAVNATGIGMLLIGSRAHRHISGEDLSLLLTIAQQLGLTLSNARLRQVVSENEALRQANQLKSAFLASVSHDLRSPLTAIRASVEDLLDRQHAVSVSEHRALLCNIARETARLSRFVDQLLDLSRIEAGTLPIDREWVELAALVNDVVAGFSQQHPGCHIETFVSPTLPLIYIDPLLLTQVLWNLLENAHKYGPPTGPITIEAFCTNTQLVISVSDRGPGIPPSERRRIFDRFYRLERDRRSHRSGSGLGLAICHGIITAHGGDIWVDDRPHGGSVFRIALPLAGDEPSTWVHEDGSA
ncbi:ATP-binding protein [Chloroflexus sp.]|uniref:ATP-binding protein n=1 Tax=Chloroflexus sp. TaxID=1904827 RepID=UPI00298EEBDF|nr:ATP-binding protein [Chloroflexus sp.]MDW8404232.1 ATP-binding protein [Chloroflexus sp.]